MKKTVLIISAVVLGCSLLFADGKKEEKKSGSDILSVSGLTGADFENAASYYKSQSEHGHDMYALEYKFALAASELGSREAKLWIGEMYQGGHVSGVTGDAAVQTAVEWWNKAADAGQPRGYTNIGLLYLHTSIPGGGDNFGSFPVDYDKALEYLVKATDAGDMKAPRNLGLMYAKGQGPVKQDDAKAAEYFEKAAKLNDSTGIMYFADYLLAGKGVAQNTAEALSLYQKIVDTKGHDIANCAYRLGVIYEEGKYVPADKAKALNYYQTAADNGSADGKTALQRLNK